jgi:hypothetical protein
MARDRTVDLLLSTKAHQRPQELHPHDCAGASDAHAVSRPPALTPGRQDLDRGVKEVARALDDVAVDHRDLHGW